MKLPLKIFLCVFQHNEYVRSCNGLFNISVCRYACIRYTDEL